MRLKEFKTVVEDEGGKNTHLEHIEDLIFLQGAAGAKSALQYINSVRDMLEEGGSVGKGVTVKWDGAPAIVTGIDPQDGKFFVAKKGAFNVSPKLYKSNQDIDSDITKEGLNAKMKIALAELSKLGIQGVVQGDMMYTKGDLQEAEIDGKDSFVFQPNTITYAVPKESELGKRIAQSNMGIIFHTTYASAMKSANFDAVNSNDYKQLFMQYVNARIRRGDQQIADPNSFAQDFAKWYNDYVQKDISKLKNQDPEAPAVKKRLDKINAQNKFVNDNMAGIAGALAVYKDIIALKNMLINKLNNVDSIKSLLKTDTGYKVVNPEGFVAIGTESGAVKLVDRMEFSKNNFSAIKNWSK
jgi:hypothetical protein